MLRKTRMGILFCGFVSFLYSQEPSAPKSPEVLSDNSVIFRLKAPNLETVAVSGTWPSEYDYVQPMEKKDSIFELTLGPLPSGMYEYTFLVDGIRVLDPNNKEVTRDGTHIENRLMIPGDQADYYDVKSVPHGKVTSLWYDSPVTGSQRRMYVYTPPGYDNTSKSYPVLYLLHGGGGDEDGWITRGRANYILDNMIAKNEAEPMIVVITNGDPKNYAAPLDMSIDRGVPEAPGINTMASKKFEKSLVEDVIPFVEKNYRVKDNAQNRAITGFSMGGYQTQ
ncbi:alpha/beta hydrolase-fold protein [Maribacter litopenaei]|uniref:Alpha/beta hydrolase-fold protein n=1 Tax=Maribacter litopenaei TaxID=2976127 RepID=A0ABY5Y5Y2_9FLAO|nr:esterase [Maribacter litopenaei]UWX54289.1 alpha/beta hydrolase-fold protein [Maribacter litopenaei]